jgi:hypothetical protein
MSDRSAGKNSQGRVSATRKANTLERVRREHKAVVMTLNSKAVSFVVRSADGIAMYLGIESHSNNGNMPEIARAGHAAALRWYKKKAAATAAGGGARGGALPDERQDGQLRNQRDDQARGS